MITPPAAGASRANARKPVADVAPPAETAPAAGGSAALS